MVVRYGSIGPSSWSVQKHTILRLNARDPAQRERRRAWRDEPISSLDLPGNDSRRLDDSPNAVNTRKGYSTRPSTPSKSMMRPSGFSAAGISSRPPSPANRPRTEMSVVLYSNGAPSRTKPRTHISLKLLVIFPAPNDSTAVGADFGLTLPQGISARLTTACASRSWIVVLSSEAVEASRPGTRSRRSKQCTPESS